MGELAVHMAILAAPFGPQALVALGPILFAQGDGVDTRPFWTAVTGYENLEDVDAIDPLRRGPHLWFHELDPPRPGRGRTHIDVSVPADVIVVGRRGLGQVAGLLLGSVSRKLAGDSQCPVIVVP